MLRQLTLSLLLAGLTAGGAFAQYGPPQAPGYGPASYPAVQQPWSNAGYPVPSYGGMPVDAATAVSPSLETELVPADRGLSWDYDSALDLAVQDTMHGMWFRLEYMNFMFDNPGRGLLGAPLANIDDPREPFIISTPASVLLVARALDVSPVRFDNINGIRGTWGIPLHAGHIEAVFWATEQDTSTIIGTELPHESPFQDVQVLVTPLLTNGQPGGNVIIYDESFRAPYSAKMFNAEANFYYNYRNPRLGLRFLPVLGFRHTDYDESLAQRGTFSNRSGASAVPTILSPPLLRQIDSWVDNNTYGVQTGFRSEFVHQAFTLGVEPKLALGVNHYEATVRTADLRDSGPYPPLVDDGVVTTNARRDVFSPIFDLQLYAKIHLNDSIRLRVGWSYTWMGNTSRADRNIYYNDLGTAFPPAVVVRPNETSQWVSAITVGGEIILP